ncbi:hypothetical protein AVEN_230228-1 [Araneus ventricosus]|uniref:Uncharacterized protein n=1 Tax=Araneus ventricosus TaxID=182803 RepID=A0A4Y2DUR5_ARAVE|nr:hypothetical protein AVEN_230228-1 [Araneus ventricosus]
MCAQIPLVNDVRKCACEHRTQNPSYNRSAPEGEHLTPTYDLTCNRPSPNTMDLQWNRVSSLEPSGNKAETFPLGHHQGTESHSASRVIKEIWLLSM